MNRLSYLSLVAVAAAFLIAAPAAAVAADYCVGSPTGCSGTSEGSNLQQALDDAGANPGGDQVLIGPGTYTRVDGFTYHDSNSENTVEIRGVGSPTLTMTTAASHEFVLDVAQTFSSVSDLAIDIPNLGSITPGMGTHSGGLQLGSNVSAQDVNVTGPSAPLDQQIGMQLDGSVVGTSSVHLALDPVVGSIGIYVNTPGSAGIYTSTIVGSHAIDLASGYGTTTLSRDRISALNDGLTVYNGKFQVDNTLIDLRGGNGAGPGLGSHAIEATAGYTTVDAKQLTIRNGDADSVAVEEGNSNYSSDIDVRLTNSIIRDIGHAIEQRPPLSGSSTQFTATNDDYDASGNLPATPSSGMSRSETGIVNVDPLFIASASGVNGLSGDYRLPFNSPVIDAGTSIPPDWFEKDLGGLERIVDGAAPFAGPVRDLGAFEYQRRAPIVTATATPSGAPPGQSITFDGSGSSDPDDDPITYSWSFDDGATATSAVVSHTFTDAGMHSGTLRVTDGSGLTAMSTVTVPIYPPGSTVPIPNSTKATTKATKPCKKHRATHRSRAKKCRKKQH
jgi:hypothetical protein